MKENAGGAAWILGLGHSAIERRPLGRIRELERPAAGLSALRRRVLASRWPPFAFVQFCTSSKTPKVSR